jgi:hypothetical protein
MRKNLEAKWSSLISGDHLVDVCRINGRTYVVASRAVLDLTTGQVRAGFGGFEFQQELGERGALLLRDSGLFVCKDPSTSKGTKLNIPVDGCCMARTWGSRIYTSYLDGSVWESDLSGSHRKRLMWRAKSTAELSLASMNGRMLLYFDPDRRLESKSKAAMWLLYLGTGGVVSIKRRVYFSDVAISEDGTMALGVGPGVFKWMGLPSR